MNKNACPQSKRSSLNRDTVASNKIQEEFHNVAREQEGKFLSSGSNFKKSSYVDPIFEIEDGILLDCIENSPYQDQDQDQSYDAPIQQEHQHRCDVSIAPTEAYTMGENSDPPPLLQQYQLDMSRIHRETKSMHA